MRKWIWFLVPAVILGGLVGWRFVDKTRSEAALKKESGARRGSSPAVQLAVAGPQIMRDTIESVGSVESPNRALVSSKVTGRIDSITVREGDRVQKGDVLVRIDPTELRAAVLQQQAQVAEAKSRLAEAQLGSGSNEASVTGQIELQAAGLASAKADLKQVRENLGAQIASADSAVEAAEARVTAAQAQVNNALAEVKRQEASLKNAESRLNRLEGLLKQGYVSLQEVENARTAADLQRRSVEVANGQVESAKAAHAVAVSQLSGEKNNASIVRRKGVADTSSAEARVAQALAGSRVAAANKTQTSAYRQNIEALRSSVAAAEAQLSQAKTRLAETDLRAPLTGAVTERNVDPGSLASAGQSLIVVQSLEWLFVTSSLPLKQIGRVHIGQKASLKFDSLPGKEFVGTVATINPSAESTSRQFTFQVRVENPKQEILPGMFGHISILVSERTSNIAVPLEAVKTSADGKATVTYVDGKNEANTRDVTPGATAGGYMEILKGLNAGDKVVVLAYQPVKDGQSVQEAGKEESRKGAGGSGSGRSRG